MNRQKIIKISSLLTLVLLMVLTCAFYYSSHFKRRARETVKVQPVDNGDREKAVSIGHFLWIRV